MIFLIIFPGIWYKVFTQIQYPRSEIERIILNSVCCPLTVGHHMKDFQYVPQNLLFLFMCIHRSQVIGQLCIARLTGQIKNRQFGEGTRVVFFFSAGPPGRPRAGHGFSSSPGDFSWPQSRAQRRDDWTRGSRNSTGSLQHFTREENTAFRL